jgi:hypothetical protein
MTASLSHRLCYTVPFVHAAHSHCWQAHGGVPQRLVVKGDGTLGFDANTAAEPPNEYAFVVVDEAHHIYSRGVDGAMSVFATDLSQLLERSALACAFCSDLSQTEGSDKVALPPVECTIVLTEVVRNSARVVQASAAFLTLPDTITAFSDQPGPPLMPFVFKACATEQLRRERYVSVVTTAIAQLEIDFPGLPLHGNMSILAPDAVFAAWLREGLQKTGRFEFVDAVVGAKSLARGASSRGETSSSQAPEQIIVDSVASFDGMERLIVFAVGLDVSVDDRDAKEASCSQIYRALTRAHMFAVVVQEHVPSGWLEFLSVVEHHDVQAAASPTREPVESTEPPVDEPLASPAGDASTDAPTTAATTTHTLSPDLVAEEAAPTALSASPAGDASTDAPTTAATTTRTLSPDLVAEEAAPTALSAPPTGDASTTSTAHTLSPGLATEEAPPSAIVRGSEVSTTGFTPTAGDTGVEICRVQTVAWSQRAKRLASSLYNASADISDEAVSSTATSTASGEATVHLQKTVPRIPQSVCVPILS